MAGLEWLTVVIRLRTLLFCCDVILQHHGPTEPCRQPVAALAHWALAGCRLSRIVCESSGIHPMNIQDQILQNADNNDRRSALIESYIDRVIDNMSTKDLVRIVWEQLQDNLSSYSDEELIAEIDNYYPDLLEN